jgi:RND family efflux transporter MFP subunit
VAALVVFFVFAEGDFRVPASTVLEPLVRQASVAPFTGYIAAAPARAGDAVRAGQVLAVLDDRELQLQRQKWQSQQDQLGKQYNQAMALRNAAQVVILSAQIDQARAEVALLDDQLRRTRLTAPFDGVVVTGDLSQSLAAPVERGQLLFEVAPLDAYRMILQVDERDIAYVSVGQRGTLLLTGAPADGVGFTVEKLTPVSTAREGRNFFRVEARMEEGQGRLRPGMEGVAKIDVDRRLLSWIWTRQMIDWIRLQLWTWLP